MPVSAEQVRQFQAKLETTSQALEHFVVCHERLEGDLETLRETVAELSRLLRGQNGTPGLLTKLALLEQRWSQDEHQRTQDKAWWWGILGKLVEVGIIAGVVYLLTGKWQKP